MNRNKEVMMDDERERLILRNHHEGGAASSTSSSSSFYWSKKKTFIAIALAVGAGVAIATGNTTTTSSPRGSVGAANTAVAGGGHRRPRGILPSAKLGVISEGVAANAPVGGKNHFFNGLLVREDERALLQKYTTKIPSRREIEKMETEEAAAASLGGYDDTRRREGQGSEDDTAFANAEAAGLGAMPRRSWKKSSEKAKEEQSRETKEFLAALGEMEKPSPALLEAATKLLREKHGEETPLDAKQQRDAEEMTANTIALVRAEKSVVAQSEKKKGSSETSEPSSTTTSSPTEDKKEDVDKIKPSQPQSLLEIAQNFLKSEEEAKARAEAEIEAAAKEEKKEGVEGQPSEEKKEDEGKVEASAEEEDDKPSPKAIEFAKLLLAGEVKKVEPADGNEAEAKKIDGVLGKPTPEILAAARQMLLKAGVNLDAEKSFASTSALKSTKVKEMTSTLRDKSIASAQDEEGKKIPKRSWVPKLGEDTDDANKAVAAAAADSSEASTPLESTNNDNNNNINNEQQEEGEPAQGQQVHEMPKTEDIVAEAANEIAAENEERKEGGEQQQEQKEQEQQQQEQKDGQEQQQQQEPEQQPEAGVMPKAEEQVQDNAQVEEERKEEGQDRPVVYLSQVPIKEKEVKAQQYAQEHQAQEANVGVDEQKEEGQLKIPRILADNVKLIDGDGREYMQPKAHELWNNGKTLFVYPQTKAQKQKPIPDATDLHAFVITLDKRLDLDSADSDTDTTMWERTQERLKEIPLIHAEKSPGVDPKAWPQSGLQEALYATGFARLFWNIHQNDPLYADLPPERRTVAELPWIGEVEKRDQNGYFRAQSQGLSHHYGCLYAHLYQWQKIKDTGLKKALILESDGLSLTRVPLESIPSVAKQMPGDADFVTLQLYPYEPAGVERRNVEIKHPTSGEHKTYSFDKLNYHPQQGYAGLASYIATDTFVEKIQHFLALHGADMIDGYILNKLCTTSYNNEEAKNIAWTMYDMQKYTHPFDPQNPTPTILNCYKALADPEYYHDLNIRMEAEARAD